MNIFVVDLNPLQAARDLCDQHVLKMIIESCQILSTVMIQNGVEAPMKQTHTHHPCVVWTNKSKGNFEWLLNHALELCNEFEFRYKKVHAVRRKLNSIAEHTFRPKELALTKFATAFKKYPELICDDVVSSYRAYYIYDKVRFAKWNHGRKPPQWWTDYFTLQKNMRENDFSYE